MTTHLEENHKHFHLHHPRDVPVTVIHVDSGETDFSGPRCDFMLTIHDLEIYVELKGKDVFHAVAQIENTINHCGSKDCKKRRCYVVYSHFPKFPKARTRKQNEKARFAKLYRAILDFVQTPCHADYAKIA